MPRETAEKNLDSSFAMQSSPLQRERRAEHVAIIMDGNGRWATGRGLPRSAGHRAGAQALQSVLEAAPTCGISTLTLFAFSSDNWQRPAAEVDALMALLERYLRGEVAHCRRAGVRLSVVGRRDRLSSRVVTAIEAAEQATRLGSTILLRLAIDYSAREAIGRAASMTSSSDPESFRAALLRAVGSDPSVPDVDLLIRTGGEQRLSDFLLWECAYAELYFSSCMWPDFGAPELEAALEEFEARERRFGRIPTETPGAGLIERAPPDKGQMRS